MEIRILDPTVAPDPIEAVTAERLGSLDGKVLGVLSNGKANAAQLLEQVARALGRRHALGGVIALAKPDSSRVAPDEVMDELARRCDAVVTAIGD